jgi:hypothetical protein
VAKKRSSKSDLIKKIGRLRSRAKANIGRFEGRWEIACAKMTGQWTAYTIVLGMLRRDRDEQ